MDDNYSAINTRVTVLELTQVELNKAREHHQSVLEKLLEQDQQLVLALQNISSKFDRLISQFSTGFRVLTICGTLATLAIGGFWAYTQDLDHKYQLRGEVPVHAIKR